MITYILSDKYTSSDLQMWDDNSLTGQLSKYMINANKVVRIVVVGKQVKQYRCLPRVLEDYLSKAQLGVDYLIK